MAELRNIRWKRLLKDLISKQSREIFLKSRSLQWALTYCLRQQNHIVLNELEDLILEYRGIKYLPHVLNYPRIFEAYDRYKIEELLPTDIVLDLGANIGSFSLPAAKIAKKVTAVEPLFSFALKENIKLNHLLNVTVIEGSIGTTKVNCQEYKGKAKMLPILAVPIEPSIPSDATFVRMDIGGAEWLIDPYVIITPKVRHLELELHFWTREQRKNSKEFVSWMLVLEKRGLNSIIRRSKHGHWIYISADKSYKEPKWVQLRDGSFIGRSKEGWNEN